MKLAEDYANNVIMLLLMADTEAEEKDRMPAEMLKFWIEEIRAYAVVTADHYLTGTREDYKFTDVETLKLWEKASERYTQFILDGLVDKGLVQVSINDKGDLLYGLTEDGRDYTDTLED